MGQENIINHGFIKRKLGIFKNINALLHTVIHQYFFLSDLQTVTASGHLMIRSYKSQFHCNYPPV